MSDLIDRQAVIDLLKQMRKDGDMVPWEGKDVFARIRKLPTIQPEKAQLSQEDATSDLISRQAAIDAINSWRGRFSEEYNEAIDDCENSIKELPTAQPELTDEQAITHLQSSGWMQRHDKEMYESGLKEYLADDSDSYDSLLPSAQPEPQWIPVESKMPEDMQFVLLTVRRLKNGYNHEPFISVGYIGWNHQHWWCAHDGDCEISKVEVLAWMPLPEPYTK